MSNFLFLFGKGEAAIMSPNRRVGPLPGAVALPSMTIRMKESVNQGGDATTSTSSSAIGEESDGNQQDNNKKKLEHAALNRATLQRPRRRGAPSPRVEIAMPTGEANINSEVGERSEAK